MSMTDMNYVHLGPVPAMECCATPGSINYGRDSILECRIFKRMLDRVFPVPEGANASFTVMQSTTDNGYFNEVVLQYSDNGQLTPGFGLEVAKDCPRNWDDRAIYELTWWRLKDGYSAAVQSNEIAACLVPETFKGLEPPVPIGGSLADVLLTLMPMRAEPIAA